MENPRSEIGGDSRIGPMIPPSDAFIRDTNTVLGAPQCLPVWGLISSPAVLYTKNIDTRGIAASGSRLRGLLLLYRSGTR